MGTPDGLNDCLWFVQLVLVAVPKKKTKTIHLLLVEVGQDKASSCLQLRLGVGPVVRPRLHVFWRERELERKTLNKSLLLHFRRIKLITSHQAFYLLILQSLDINAHKCCLD